MSISMRVVGCLLVCAAPSFAGEELLELRARILDEQGRPAAGILVAPFWSANGLTWREIESIPKEEMAAHVRTRGHLMQPWGTIPTATTDAEGKFSLGWQATRWVRLLALDPERQRGALIGVDPSQPGRTVEARLQPLARVHGGIRAAETGAQPEWCAAYVHLPFDAKFPLADTRLAHWGSESWTLKSGCEFWLPPGEYACEAYSHSAASLRTPQERKFTIKANDREVDLGILEMMPCPSLFDKAERAKSQGEMGDYRKHFGKRPPRWHITDARGVGRDVEPTDFKGKWVVLYLWSPRCGSCLATDLPKLMSFYEAHQAQRDKFEILSLCFDDSGDMKSMADLERFLKPIVDNVWGGKNLPFPLLLDDSLQTIMSWGIDAYGPEILIDPEGHLVEGDLETLEKSSGHRGVEHRGEGVARGAGRVARGAWNEADPWDVHATATC